MRVSTSSVVGGAMVTWTLRPGSVHQTVLRGGTGSDAIE